MGTNINSPEIEQWIARFRRIWGPDNIIEMDLKVSPGRPPVVAYLFGHIRLKDGIDLGFDPTRFAIEKGDESRNYVGHISVFKSNGRIFHFEGVRGATSQNGQGLFVSHWLPICRRNFWLMGIPIESTAHEKIEWLQGFTQQEIEDWQLTF